MGRQQLREAPQKLTRDEFVVHPFAVHGPVSQLALFSRSCVGLELGDHLLKRRQIVRTYLRYGSLGPVYVEEVP